MRSRQSSGNKTGVAGRDEVGRRLLLVRSVDMRVISGEGEREMKGGGRAGVIRQEMRPLNQTIGREREIATEQNRR